MDVSQGCDCTYKSCFSVREVLGPRGLVMVSIDKN
jgi:hypothetical protein